MAKVRAPLQHVRSPHDHACGHDPRVLSRLIHSLQRPFANSLSVRSQLGPNTFRRLICQGLSRQLRDFSSDTPRDLEPSPSSAISMYHFLASTVPRISSLCKLDLNPHATLPRRTPPHNVGDDLGALDGPGRRQCIRSNLACVVQQSLPSGKIRSTGPVSGLLRSSNDGAAVEKTRYDETPRSIGLLQGDRVRSLSQVCKHRLAYSGKSAMFEQFQVSQSRHTSRGEILRIPETRTRSIDDKGNTFE